MIDLSTIVPTLLGALISGLIGLITVEYRHRKESREEVREWYEKTIRLAERIERVDRKE